MRSQAQLSGPTNKQTNKETSTRSGDTGGGVRHHLSVSLRGGWDIGKYMFLNSADCSSLSEKVITFSGENNRTIGRPKVKKDINEWINSLINSFINELIKKKDFELWFVENKLYTI